MIRIVRLLSAILLALAIVLEPSFAWATSQSQPVIRQDEGPLATALHVPVYIWRNPDVTPRAVIVTIHGVSLHGAVFDHLANALAQEGFVVVSPDLRGFGRWYLGKDCYLVDGRVSFYKSRADLVRLLGTLRQQYATVPIYCVGESIGANLALWLASTFPDYLDGIVISSPCVKRRWDLCSTLVVDTLKAATDRDRQVPIAPYAKRYLSEDPRITEAYLNDPLIRKTMSVHESLQSLHTARSTLWFVDRIPANIPLLAFVGTKDKMFDPKQITALLKRINVDDQKICWLNGRGHIHLETPHVSEDVLKTISGWLSEHSARAGKPTTLVSTEESPNYQKDNN